MISITKIANMAQKDPTRHHYRQGDRWQAADRGAHFWKCEACAAPIMAKRVRVNVTFIAMPRWRFRNWIEAIERPSSLAYIPTSERIAKPLCRPSRRRDPNQINCAPQMKNSTLTATTTKSNIIMISPCRTRPASTPPSSFRKSRSRPDSGFSFADCSNIRSVNPPSLSGSR